MTPTLPELLASAHVVRVPLRVRFRGVSEREALLLHGPAGWGEWSPFVEYPSAEAARWLSAAIEAAWHGWPEPVRDRIPVNATVPAVAADEVAGVLARYDGCAAVKVKVAERGQSLGDDLARVAAVRDVVGWRTAEGSAPVSIRVDANGAWSVDEALGALARLGRYGLEYAEQPCATVDELATLRVRMAKGGIEIPIAADESIRKADDPLRVAEAEAADLMVVKVAPLGGVRNAIRIAEQVGLPAVVSSALDTSVGIRAGVALAAALPELPYACGLATVELLDGDVAAERLVPGGGALPVRDVAASPDLLERYAAPPERQQWWRERLEAAYTHLLETD
ncbi:MAG: o-succinylbenzoate synthase [Dermatophilus congolensis]|nr:o-succinylbenzoate synthase [Dermatophilus congolensis]